MLNLNYIADLSVPNKSAYAVHVLKICDNFSKIGYNVNIYLYSNKKKITRHQIKSDFNLKDKPNLNYCFDKKVKRNLLNNLVFGFWCKKKIKKNSLIISRSIIAALILIIFNFKVILEIHHEMSGLTKIIYNFLSKLKLTKDLRFIFIHKNLQKKFNIPRKKSIILDDGVDLDDFLIDVNPKKNCVYTGSFAKGKGIELISKIAIRNPSLKIYAYGNLDTLEKKEKYLSIKNLIFLDYVKYNKIPKILKQSLILLMPYQKKIGILAKNIYVEKYISPLKLFEYLASSNIIIASKLPVYSHILKNKFNCILCNHDSTSEWSNNIKNIIKSPKKYSKIRKNAFLTAKQFTWFVRAKKIIQFSQKQSLI